MNRRKHSAIGLVLLAAITFSFVESAAAAMCPPMTEMSDMNGMQDTAGSPAQQGAAGEHGSEQDEHPGGDCPFAPAGAAQGCASASLPASGLDPLASPAAAAADLIDTETEPHLFLTSLVFHPPKF